MTDTTSGRHSSPPQRGCVIRLVAFLCSAYLFGMVAYLILRLIFGGGTWWLALLNAFAIYTFAPAFVLIVLAFFTGLWRDVVRLGLMCLLAVVWFGPFFQPQHSSTLRDGVEVRVLTFNLLHERNDDLDASLAYIASVEADIILLQERPSQFAEGIPALAESHPHIYDYGDGRLTLSRFPIMEADDGRLVLEVEGQEVAIYNVHLPVPFDNAPRIPALEDLPYIGLAIRYDESRRNERIDALLERVRAETLPAIIGGDFNTSQHSIVYSDLTLTMTDTFRETNSGLGATWPARFPLIRIDYLWHSRQGFRALTSMVGPDTGSDHRPYFAALELRPATP